MALRAPLCLSIVCSIIRLVNPELDIRPVDCKNIDGIIMHKVCYKYESTALSWEKAKQFCLEKQMTLLSSDDLMVLQNLQEAVLIVGDKDPTESHTYWLGARYKQSAAAYYWYHNKQPLPNPGSFNLSATHDSSRECLVVKRDKITEENCDKTHEFFCQHEGISKFGNNMLCHCALGYCDTDGKCLRPDSLCEKNWFAESYDIAADIESVNSLLRDNDDKTCITMRGLTLTLNKPFYFTWMRLVFKRKGENSGIQIGFRLRTQTEVACTDQVMLTIDDVTVDLICRFEQVLVTVITISWEGERSICSVYISGGQNLAYMGSTSQSGSEVTSHYTIDGVKGYPALCASTDHTLDNQYWLLLFSQPYSIHTVFLYRQTSE
ncbi:uncharacterized protein LOC131943516 isoform X2 [Physella acuta]|uniref:uncharacterized protein LOC131943516 isoform X2 n=1 Tax=Physella acuta TaxID=109671 RepID=UPI0027DD454E|nr:uncharacterized protein LOC131943516 isoform X2 [Physella acuta]